jgi:hypothetical protein
MRKANPLIYLLEVVKPGPCRGHFIGVTYRGSLVFYNHDVRELKAESAFATLGKVEPCDCAQYLNRVRAGDRLRSAFTESKVKALFVKITHDARVKRGAIKRRHPNKGAQTKGMREWTFRQQVSPGPSKVSGTDFERAHERIAFLYYPGAPQDWPPDLPEDRLVQLRSADLWDVLRKG